MINWQYFCSRNMSIYNKIHLDFFFIFYNRSNYLDTNPLYRSNDLKFFEFHSFTRWTFNRHLKCAYSRRFFALHTPFLFILEKNPIPYKNYIYISLSAYFYTLLHSHYIIIIFISTVWQKVEDAYQGNWRKCVEKGGGGGIRFCCKNRMQPRAMWSSFSARAAGSEPAQRKEKVI